MRNIKILDTTLRDGGRVINCAFPDAHISGIASGLTNANIDIVEMGFLRGYDSYSGNSTFFTSIDQISEFIPKNRKNTEYYAFGDYGKEFHMWDFSKLTPCDGSSITGIRIGYRKKDLHDAVEVFRIVKENGYKLFIQGVESLSYSEEEMIEAIKIINEIHPAAFGIVDTYGSMYKDDVLHLYQLVDEHLDKDIAIDFHSHNNMQLSFSFAQEIIEASKGKREIVIDATLEGISKGAGNLNTELIVDYLNLKKNYNYDLDIIMDAIDDYIFPVKEKNSWTYSIPSYLAGIYSSHANNITYLMEKHRIKTKDIGRIISMIEPEKRKRYDYDNIEKLYIEYCSSNVDDQKNLDILACEMKGKDILVVVPGKSISQYTKQISYYIRANSPIVISVNFEYKDDICNYCFYGNQRRYSAIRGGKPRIITSNIKPESDLDYVINFNKLIDRSYKNFDNSTIMLLNLLRRLEVKKITIAGFDGYDMNEQNYFDQSYVYYNKGEASIVNQDIYSMLRHYKKVVEGQINIQFLTPSMFLEIFAEDDFE